MTDRAKFFAGIRSLSRLTQSQVDGFNAVLDAAPANMPRKQLAYCLATAWHETAGTMQPIEEYGRGKGRPYGPTGYWGRGYVQLTWDYNYKKAGAELGVDLYGNPKLALDPGIAAKIMFRGMTEGWFTGKKLDDFITAKVVNYRGARRIINGMDRAEQIAAYANLFAAAL